jgi:hypothetical protein
MSWFFLIILNTRHTKLLSMSKERETKGEAILFARFSKKNKRIRSLNHKRNVTINVNNKIIENEITTTFIYIYISVSERFSTLSDT